MDKVIDADIVVWVTSIYYYEMNDLQRISTAMVKERLSLFPRPLSIFVQNIYVRNSLCAIMEYITASREAWEEARASLGIYRRKLVVNMKTQSKVFMKKYSFMMIMKNLFIMINPVR